MKAFFVCSFFLISLFCQSQSMILLEEQTVLTSQPALRFTIGYSKYFVRKQVLKGQYGIIAYATVETRTQDATAVIGGRKAFNLANDGFMYLILGTGLTTARTAFLGMGGIHAEVHPHNEYRLILSFLGEYGAIRKTYRCQVSRSVGRVWDVGVFSQYNVVSGAYASYKPKHAEYWVAAGYNPEQKSPGAVLGIRLLFD